MFTCLSCSEKINYNLYLFFLYVFFFSLAASKIFLLTSAFGQFKYDVPWCGFLHFPSSLGCYASRIHGFIVFVIFETFWSNTFFWPTFHFSSTRTVIMCSMFFQFCYSFPLLTSVIFSYSSFVHI